MRLHQFAMLRSTWPTRGGETLWEKGKGKREKGKGCFQLHAIANVRRGVGACKPEQVRVDDADG